MKKFIHFVFTLILVFSVGSGTYVAGSEPENQDAQIFTAREHYRLPNLEAGVGNRAQVVLAAEVNVGDFIPDLEVKAPVFETAFTGYTGSPAARPIEIRNYGIGAATNISLTLGGTNPTAFTLIPGNDIIAGGATDKSWMIQPAADLAAGMYRAEIAVEGEHGSPGEVVFFVSDDVLQEITWYLSEIIGQRIYSTPAEQEACEYIADQFKKHTTAANGWNIGVETVEVYNTMAIQDGLMQRSQPQRVAQINLGGQNSIYGRPYPAFTAAVATANDNLMTDGYDGLFFDFGYYDTRTGVTGDAMASGLKFPAAEQVAAHGGKIYGTIRFHRDASGMLPSRPGQYTAPPSFNAPVHIAAVRNAIIAATGADVTGLFVAVSDAGGDHDMAGQYMELGSSVPSAGITAVAANFSPPFVTMPLRQLEKVKTAGERGLIQGVDRYFAYESYNTFAIKPAKNGDPDLAMVFIGHIDGVFCSPSANDNGSSVASLVELARHFDSVNTDHVELIFAAVGGEEFSGFNGAANLGWLLKKRGVRDIAVAWSMDMISAKEGSDTQWGGKVDTFNVGVYMGSDNWNEPIFNLSSHLVMSHARDVSIPDFNGSIWEPGRYGIKDAYFINYHNSDHEMMNHFGVDAARLVLSGRAPITGASTANSMETRYHTAQDTFDENYGYERNRMTVNFLKNGAHKALDLELTKRAQFALAGGNALTLTNADRLLKAFDRVEVTLEHATEPKITVVFDKENKTVEIPEDYRIVRGLNVKAFGTGIPAHTDREDVVNRLSPVFMTYMDVRGPASLVIDRIEGPCVVIETPAWNPVRVGYGADGRRSKALQIHNIGNTEARLTWPAGLTPGPSPAWPTAVSATNGWTVSGTGGRIVAGGTHQRWTLQPPAGLGTGIHETVVTVRYREGLTGSLMISTATATFLVHPATGCEWEFKELIDPTCTEQGYELYECRYCKDIESRNFVAESGHDFGPPQAIPGNAEWAIVYCLREGCSHSESIEFPLITSIRINALSIATVVRGGEYNFTFTLNEGALGNNVFWTFADPSFGYVDTDGKVTIFDKIGNVRLTATDAVSGLSHSITLRIAS